MEEIRLYKVESNRKRFCQYLFFKYWEKTFTLYKNVVSVYISELRYCNYFNHLYCCDFCLIFVLKAQWIKALVETIQSLKFWVQYLATAGVNKNVELLKRNNWKWHIRKRRECRTVKTLRISQQRRGQQFKQRKYCKKCTL